MSQPTISLCMIVKNEESHLPRCLGSIRGAVDEIIVVDTGSHDNTVKIADSFGAKILSLPWSGDFSFCRNAGLAAARGTWILILDADEELDENGQEELRLCSTHLEYDGFFLQIHNHAGESRQSATATINPILRMFRNRPEHRFRGKIHEQIAYAITERNPQAALHLSSVKIHHYGYAHDIVVKRDKIQRNLQLLAQELRDRPNDPFHHYNIAVEYMRMNDFKQALEHLRTSIALTVPEISYAHLLHKYEARCLLQLGEHQEAAQVCDRAISLFPDYTDLYHVKGAIHLAAGAKSQALAAFLQAVEQGPAPALYHTEPGMGTFLSAYALGRLFEESGDDANAVHWYTEAVKQNSNRLQPLMRIFRIFKTLGMEQDIPRLLSERFRLSSPETLVNIVNALLEDSCFQAASALLSQLDEEEYECFRSSAMRKCELWSGKTPAAAAAMAASGKGPIAESSATGPSARIDERELAIKSAYFNHRADQALELIGLWRQNKQADADSTAYEAYRKSRTLIALADAQLGRHKSASPHYSLIRLARQSLPLARSL